MSKAAKIWFITAILIVFLAGIILGGVMTVSKWDFLRVSFGKYEENTYEIIESFNNISVNSDTADITFVLSDDGKCYVECFEKEMARHSVKVSEDTLVIELLNNKAWYDYIGINFGTPKIKVFLTQKEYSSLYVKGSTGNVEIPEDFSFGNIDISLSTGDICIEDVSCSSLDLSASTGKITVSDVICEGDIAVNVSTGKVKFEDIKCKNLSSGGSTGHINLDGVIAAKKLSIKRSTGDIKFEECDAGEIFAQTETGDITGTLLTDKIFYAHTDTGKISVPKSLSGGMCEINTDTGNIKFEIFPKAEVDLNND